MSETDDEFWARLLGDDDPCTPGKDWASAAFNSEPISLEPARTTTRVPAREAHTEGTDARRPQVEAGETGDQR